MTEDDYRTALRGFVAEEFLDEEARPDLTDTTPLIASGILDSLRIAVLLTFIRDRLGVRVPLEKIDGVHFGTINAMVDVLTAATPVAAGEGTER
jgi:acyl carrier protein